MSSRSNPWSAFKARKWCSRWAAASVARTMDLVVMMRRKPDSSPSRVFGSRRRIYCSRRLFVWLGKGEMADWRRWRWRVRVYKVRLGSGIEEPRVDIGADGCKHGKSNDYKWKFWNKIYFIPKLGGMCLHQILEWITGTWNRRGCPEAASHTESAHEVGIGWIRWHQHHRSECKGGGLHWLGRLRRCWHGLKLKGVGLC